ncbi:MAG: hypothetical protein ACR2PI_12555 [Hyphomicrobiaceae bacterium]
MTEPDVFTNRSTLLVLVGGPSGAGKTTLSNHLIGGQSIGSFQIPSDLPILRTDSRSMLQKGFGGGVLLVEFATNRLVESHHKMQAKLGIPKLVALADRVITVTYSIDKKELLRRYRQRMAHETLRRTPELLRYLRFGKWKGYLKLGLSNDIEQGYREWREILAAQDSGSIEAHLVVHSSPAQPGEYFVKEA